MQKIKNNSIVIEIDYLNSELGKKIMNFNILYYQISFRDNQNMACYYVCTLNEEKDVCSIYVRDKKVDISHHKNAITLWSNNPDIDYNIRIHTKMPKIGVGDFINMKPKLSRKRNFDGLVLDESIDEYGNKSYIVQRISNNEKFEIIELGDSYGLKLDAFRYGYHYIHSIFIDKYT
jgi:hypothetical protein